MNVFITDPYTIVQTAGETYIGDATDQTYSINPALIQVGDVVTIVDQGGSNAIELPAGLEISESKVTNNELVLTLSNGAIVNVRGADTFTFNVGQNKSAGDNVGTELKFEQYAQDILGVTLPAEGEDLVTGGSSIINDDGTADIDPGNENSIAVAIDTAAFPIQTVFDADGDGYNFIDDAAISNYAVINNFSADDTISFVNAVMSDYAFSNEGEDVILSYNYNDEGTMNVIKLAGVVTENDLVVDQASLVAAIGFDVFG